MSKILELPEIKNLLELEKQLNAITLSEEERLAIVEKINELDIYQFSKGLAVDFDGEMHPVDREWGDGDMKKIQEAKISEEMVEHLKTFKFIDSVLTRDGEDSYTNYCYYSKDLGIVAYLSEGYDSWNDSEFDEASLSVFLVKLEDFRIFEPQSETMLEKFIK